MKIYKYKLDNFISIKGYKKMLSVVVIDEVAYVYALVSPFIEISSKFNFDIVATGQDFIHNGTFLGTILFNNGALVYHVFYY